MRGRTALAAVAAVLALAGTVAAVATAPDTDAITAVFPVRGGLGDSMTARQLSATVTAVRVVKSLKIGYSSAAGSTATDGVWVVVDADVTPRLGTLVLGNSTVTIDGIAYRASDILPAPSLASLPYGAGVPMHGTLVFELPASALKSPGAKHAEIAFVPSIDSRLDSVPTATVDLSGASVDARAVIDAPYVLETK